MSKPLAVAAVAWSVISAVFMTPGSAAAQDVNTGSIRGTISGVACAENVTVYIEKAPGEYPPPEEPAEMDQVKLEFVPHVLPIVKGTTVRFHNHDPVAHNITWPACCNGAYPSYSLGMWDQGIVKEFTYDTEGRITLLCKIHPRMEAFIIVLQNPFWGLTDKEGTYEIREVPPGEYTLKTRCCKSCRKLEPKSAKVTVTAGKATVQDFSPFNRR